MTNEQHTDFDSDDLEHDPSLNQDDVALRPGPNADKPADIEQYISPEIRDRYDVFSYRHAAAILATSFPQELEEIERALGSFSISKRDIGMPGGNESDMPKKLSTILRPAQWKEARIQGDLVVKMQQYTEEISAHYLKKTKDPIATRTIENFIDGHKIDYVKGRVAFDMEWNSKDQTFDRDLYAMRTFHECGLISVGVMVTRSAKLNSVFCGINQLDKNGNPIPNEKGGYKNVKSKYGASTTWMGKLLYRLNAGRHGGCPILVFGITPKLISDWEPQ